MKNLFDLTGKRALITGSTQGIGNLLTNGLATHGAGIVINDIAQQHAQTVANKLVTEGYRAVGYGLDVTNGEEVARAIAQIEKEVEVIDILVNNVGAQCRYPFVEFPETEWGKVIDVNQKSVFLVSQQISRYMVQRHRRKIINIYSMQSELGRRTIVPYAASKDVVKTLTRGMCVGLAGYNIQVSDTAPGYFAIDMTIALINDEAFSAWLSQRTPTARWDSPKELVDAAVYLAAPTSDFVNGYLLLVGGGILAAA